MEKRFAIYRQLIQVHRELGVSADQIRASMRAWFQVDDARLLTVEQLEWFVENLKEGSSEKQSSLQE